MYIHVIPFSIQVWFLLKNGGSPFATLALSSHSHSFMCLPGMQRSPLDF